MRRRGAALAPALAFWMGAPALNLGTIAFIWIVLGWRFAALRLALALAGVVALSLLAARAAGPAADGAALLPAAGAVEQREPLGLPGGLRRWALASGRLALTLLPVYVATVLLLGAVRAWLFPLGGLPHWAALPALVGLALAGTLFSIPTAGEVPIVQALLLTGLAAGPAAALLLTLPMLSLPSLLMLRGVVPARSLLLLGAGVWGLGLLAGALAGLAI